MFSKSQLALVISAVLSTPFACAETDASTTDEHMVVTGRDYGYKADTNSSSMRMEATQLETPGQVSVIDEQLIDEQRASTLGEVLKMMQVSVPAQLHVTVSSLHYVAFH